MHGGVGYTWEFDCHLFYRRATFLGRCQLFSEIPSSVNGGEVIVVESPRPSEVIGI